MDPELKNYIDRHRIWQDLSLKQMSFFNNLLIIISIGFLGFLVKDEFFKLIHINFQESFHFKSLLFVISVIIALLSVFYGLLSALVRLYDFRLSRHIALTRLRIYKGKDWDREILKANKVEKISYNARYDLLAKIAFDKFLFFSKEDIEKLGNRESLQEEQFEELLKSSKHLGELTWIYVKRQLGFLFLSINFYLLSFLHPIFAVSFIVLGILGCHLLKKK